MIFKYLNRITFDKEFEIYELLTIKKKLEINYLNGIKKIEYKGLKFKIRCFLIIKSLKIFTGISTIDLIKKVEYKLSENFKSNKKAGSTFKVLSIDTLGELIMNPFFLKLIDFNSELEKVGSNLLVQGSYSDNTAISYSDLDLVIVGSLSKTVIKIKKLIEKELIIFDPLQHHGVFFINQNSFVNYWQMDLPIKTLKKSLVLSQKSIEINISSSFIEKYSSYYWILNFVNNYRNFPLTLETGPYLFKYFLSQLMLVPALLLATKGLYIYKRESFISAKKYYSTNAWKCIEVSSQLRMSWDQNNIDQRYIDSRSNLSDKNVVEYNCINDVVKLDLNELNAFRECFDLFINETENKMKLNDI